LCGTFLTAFREILIEIDEILTNSTQVLIRISEIAFKSSEKAINIRGDATSQRSMLIAFPRQVIVIRQIQVNIRQIQFMICACLVVKSQIK
jgi:hypothetical protein